MEENISGADNLPTASPEPPARSRKLVIISIVSLVVVGIAILFFAAYVVMPKLNQKVVDVDYEKQLADPNDELPIFDGEGGGQPEMKIAASWTEDNINSGEIEKGQVRWIEPIDLGNLNLRNPEAQRTEWIKYVKVGDVIAGDFQGAEVMLFAYMGQGMGADIAAWRVLKWNDKYIFFSSLDGRENSEYAQNQILDLKTLFGGGAVLEFTRGIRMKEFDYPQAISGSGPRQQLDFETSDYFFSTVKLKPVFTHPQLGQVWMIDPTKSNLEEPTPFELNKFKNSIDYPEEFYLDPVETAGGKFYLKAPDSTVLVYRMRPDFFSSLNEDGKNGVLAATWSDGQVNGEVYGPITSGCGYSGAVNDMTGKIDLAKDTVAVGKTPQGDILYGFKNVDVPEFTKLYDETYYAPEGTPKLDKSTFLSLNPQIFLIDPFGRTISLHLTKYLFPGECGKPVIYLYPEETTEVSVKVYPDGGFSKTEPEYGDGWNVQAESDGKITNLEDGQVYPYLFWEGFSSVSYQMPRQGFVVNNYHLEKFLSDRLGELGLNAKESADFVEFWVPKMRDKQKSYYFVTFLQKRFIDRLAPLKVEPKPDTVIRVMMDWEGLDAPRKVQAQTLKSPVRSGFTVVEWGGMLK